MPYTWLPVGIDPKTLEHACSQKLRKISLPPGMNWESNLVDELSKKVCFPVGDLDEFVNDLRKDFASSDIVSVAVLGCRGSGKTSLLNWMKRNCPALRIYDDQPFYWVLLPPFPETEAGTKLAIGMQTALGFHSTRSAWVVHVTPYTSERETGAFFQKVMPPCLARNVVFKDALWTHYNQLEKWRVCVAVHIPTEKVFCFGLADALFVQ
jgi:hypothetical protein